MDGIREIKKDIVIIGAGPAGSSFAEKMSGRGFDIMLINGQTEKNKKPCGGLLSPDAQLLFAKENKTLPKEVLCDPQIFSVVTMDLESGITKNYSRYYLNMDRAAFDDFLLKQVPDEVEILDGRCHDINKISANDGADKYLYEVCIVCKGGEKIKVRAKAVVGADGASSIVRKKFYPSMKQYIAIQEWYKRKEDEDIYYACIFDEKTSESCSWIICKEDDIIFGGCFDIKDGKEKFALQKQRLKQRTGLILDDKIRREACLVNVPEKKKDFVTGKDNVFLIGEAAGFISASSFEGISNAMKSAELLSKSFEGLKPGMITDEKSMHLIAERYKKGCAHLKRKLVLKIYKKKLLFTPFTRKFIMKSGISDIGITSNGYNNG